MYMFFEEKVLFLTYFYALMDICNNRANSTIISSY